MRVERTHLAGAVLPVLVRRELVRERQLQPLADFTSDLGSLTAAHPLPYNIGISLSGLMSVPLAVALFFVFRRSVAGRIGAVLVGVFGIGDFLDGLFREDCSPRLAACKALADGQGYSWHHQAHDIETLFTAVGLVLAPFFFAWAFRATAGWWPLARISTLWGIADVVLVVAFSAVAFQDTQPGAGFLERVLVTVATGWLALVAWRLFVQAKDAEVSTEPDSA